MSIMQWVLNKGFAIVTNRYVRQFEADTHHAGEINRQILKQILELNEQSEYGGAYNFAGIKGAHAYKKTVPVTSYQDYEGYIERMTKGEANVLTTEPIKYFALSSGTTGKQKYIPITERHRKLTNSNMTFLLQGLINQTLPPDRKAGKGLLLMHMGKPSGFTSGGLPTGAGTSEGIKAMRHILPYIWTSPLQILEMPNQQTANYLHLLFALKEQDLAYIMAPFPSGIVQLFSVLEEKWQSLLKDLAQGTISKELELDPQVKASLEHKLKPAPKRAKELEAQLSRGMAGIATRLWPNLAYISCVIGGSFSIYEDKLRYYTGKLPINSSVYGATEAPIALTMKADDVTYVVTPRTAYFEFIPVSEADSPTPSALDLDQLKIGETYEILVTNFAGLYRYQLGDVVKVVDYYHQSPIIEFQYRKGQLLNLAAEKTSEAAVQQALAAAAEKWGTRVEDFTVRLNLDGAVGCYQFFLEVADPDKVLAQPENSRDILEQALIEANPRYQAGLSAKRIAPMTLQVTKPGTFSLLRQSLLKKGASLNQVKIPRLIRDEQLLRLLEENKF